MTPLGIPGATNRLVFVDTNVLVYHRDSSEPEKQRRAAEWMAHLWDSGRGRISLQVLQEYCVTVTRKLDPGLPREEAREDVLALRARRPLGGDLDLLEEAWTLEDRHGFSCWDALILAAGPRPPSASLTWASGGLHSGIVDLPCFPPPEEPAKGGERGDSCQIPLPC